MTQPTVSKHWRTIVGQSTQVQRQYTCSRKRSFSLCSSFAAGLKNCQFSLPWYTSILETAHHFFHLLAKNLLDKHHDLQGQRSRSRWRGASINREWKVTETPKLVGRLSTPLAIMVISFKVKNQRSRSPDRLMLRAEVRHICRIGRPTNLTRRMATANKTCVSGKN